MHIDFNCNPRIISHFLPWSRYASALADSGGACGPKPRPGATGGLRLSGGFPPSAMRQRVHWCNGSCINPAVSVVSHFRPWRQPSAKSCPSFAHPRAVRQPLAIHRPWRLPGLWIASRRVPRAQKRLQSRTICSRCARHVFERCRGVCGAVGAWA